MRFSKFISEQLDQQRGLQSRLARKLHVARSTISAWRRGARPDFQVCLLLADHFRLDPFELFEMVGEPSYGPVYRRFFDPQAKRASRKPASEAMSQPAFRVEDLYRDPLHADIHRDLQELLDADSSESRAVATLIQMAARQLRDAKRPRAAAASKSDSDGDMARVRAQAG